MWRGFLDFLVPPQCVLCRKTGGWFCENHSRLLRLKTRKRQITENLVVWSEFDYRDAAVKAALLQYKFRGNKEILLPMLQPSFCRETQIFLKDAVLVPIPLHWSKRIERGFSQTDLIAQSLSTEFNLPIVRGLKKIKRTKSQSQLNRSYRLMNLNGAFLWNEKHKIPKKICLVDDVFTTGATLIEAAKVLRALGGENICAWTLAAQSELK